MISASTLVTAIGLYFLYSSENHICHALFDSTLKLWWKRIHSAGKQQKDEAPISGDLSKYDESVTYGTDVSFPMHRSSTSTSILGNHRHDVYEKFLQGCRDHWAEKGHLCDNVEKERLDQNLWQPRYMVNFTETGFKKMRAPEALYTILREFWTKNRDRETNESWFAGSIFTNYWISPSQMVSIHDNQNEGGGRDLATAVSDATREIIEEWTGLNMTSTSVYGIRVYKRDAMLVPHVDRLPLISSAIINVDQDVDEPWPLEVIGHDGIARNITMLPGDLVLYESHSILHGRPFPLNGSYFANVFIHFKPMQLQEEETGIPLYISDNADAIQWYKNEMGLNDDSQEEYGADDSRDGGNEEEMDLFVVDRNEKEEFEDTDSDYYDQHEADVDDDIRVEGNLDEERRDQTYGMNTDGQHESHLAAGDGNLGLLQSIFRENSDVIHYRDRNGWTPAHEAARGLHLDILNFLFKNGADMNVRTSLDYGLIDLAIQTGGDNHPVVTFLRDVTEKAEESHDMSINQETYDEVYDESGADDTADYDGDVQEETWNTDNWNEEEGEGQYYFVEDDEDVPEQTSIDDFVEGDGQDENDSYDRKEETEYASSVSCDHQNYSNCVVGGEDMLQETSQNQNGADDVDNEGQEQDDGVAEYSYEDASSSNDEL